MNEGDVKFSESTAAPTIFFDFAATRGALNGVLGFCLTALTISPTPENEPVQKFQTVAHLRCSAVAARGLRDSIDDLLATLEPSSPTQEKPNDAGEKRSRETRHDLAGKFDAGQNGKLQ